MLVRTVPVVVSRSSNGGGRGRPTARMPVLFCLESPTGRRAKQSPRGWSIMLVTGQGCWRAPTTPNPASGHLGASRPWFERNAFRPSCHSTCPIRSTVQGPIVQHGHRRQRSGCVFAAICFRLRDRRRTRSHFFDLSSERILRFAQGIWPARPSTIDGNNAERWQCSSTVFDWAGLRCSVSKDDHIKSDISKS